MTFRLDEMKCPIQVRFANGRSAYIVGYTKFSAGSPETEETPDELRLTFFGNETPTPFNYWADGSIAEPSEVLTEADRQLRIVSAVGVDSVYKPREDVFPIRLGSGTLQFVGSDRKYHCLGGTITEISDEPAPIVASKTTVTESATFKAL